jgi:hypothetical protein
VKALYARRVKMEREQRSDRFTAIEDRFSQEPPNDLLHPPAKRVKKRSRRVVFFS